MRSFDGVEDLHGLVLVETVAAPNVIIQWDYKNLTRRKGKLQRLN